MNRSGISRIVLCTTICLPALMLGAVHAQTLGVTLFLTGLLFALLGRDASVRMDFVGWIFLGLIALTAFQLLPLPMAVARVLSPASVALRVDTLAITGAAQPAFVPLTVDIPTTLNELAKLFCYLAIYWTVKREAQKGSVRYVLLAISILGFVCAVVFIAHRIAMADKIYGFYEPIHKTFSVTNISAPFINPNHMAAFLGLCAFVSIGLAMDPNERQRRPWHIVFAVFTGGALFLTLSRGGIAAFMTGQLVFFTMLVLRNTLYRKSERAMEISWVAWLPLGLALSLGLGMIAMGDAIIGEYVNGDVSKLGIWKESLPLIKLFAVTGAGRGGFMSVFPLVSQWTASTAFVYAENVVVQVLVDYGVIFGPVILLSFTVAIGRRMLGVPVRPTTMAIVAALIALAVHNMVDFSIEIPGVAAVAIAQLAVLTVSRRQDVRRRRIWHAAFPWVGQYVLAAISIILCIAFFSTLPSKQLEAEQNRAERALESGDRAFFKADAFGKVLYRHPGAHYIV
ncbi:MAG: O-antigen ligase family protein, partial [Deltaproteobacteria bacterium]|nr:O-antigen ligase family protein [Deltaproteobacteria bacterium]